MKLSYAGKLMGGVAAVSVLAVGLAFWSAHQETPWSGLFMTLGVVVLGSALVASVLSRPARALQSLTHQLEASRRELELANQELRAERHRQEQYTRILTTLNEAGTLSVAVDRLLAQLVDAAGAQMGAIYLYDDLKGRYVRQAAYALDHPGRAEVGLGEGLVGQAARERRTLQVYDVPGDYFRVVSGTGERLPSHLVLIPVVLRDRVLGVLELASLKPMSLETVQFLEAVTDQVAIWVQNSLAHEQIESLNYELDRVDTLVEKINQGLSLEEVVDYLYEELRYFLPYRRIGISLLDQEGNLVSRIVKTDRPVHLAPGYKAPLKGSSLERVIREGEPRIINDLEAYLRNKPTSASTRLIVQEGMRSNLTLPLILEGKPIGTLFFSCTEPNQYTQAHIRFIKKIAGHLAILIEKGRLYTELAQREKELAAKNELLAAQNEELQAQSEELQAQSEELQAQTEELQAQKAELEEKTRQVQEADRLKSEFLANMSHELRTPLNAILGYSDILLTVLKDRVEHRMYQNLDRIRISAQSLLGLINDLLDLSKIEAGKVEIIPRECDVARIVEETFNLIRPQADAKGLALKAEVAPDLPVLVCDPTRLQQVLTNLVGNAVKFTERGSVTVRVDREGEQALRFQVADTGIGIPPEQIPYIFDAFRQANGSLTRRYGGTGLGLNIARRLVELMGGRIGVESEPGKGSVFTFTLPCRFETPREAPPREPEAAPVQVEAPPGPAQLTLGPRVLVVEDDPIQSDILESILAREGYQVKVVGSGAEALRYLQRERPHLITLDIELPDMDGYALMETLRRKRRAQGVPVVVISAMDLDQEDLKRLGPAVVRVLRKGAIRQEELLALVREILGPFRRGGTTP